jgi:hypothetical protein
LIFQKYIDFFKKILIFSKNIDFSKNKLIFSKNIDFWLKSRYLVSNIEILDYRALSIIFATKTDNPKNCETIDNDSFRYINTTSRQERHQV